VNPANATSLTADGKRENVTVADVRTVGSPLISLPRRRSNFNDTIANTTANTGRYSLPGQPPRTPLGDLTSGWQEN
jgi:hypothetical protein